MIADAMDKVGKEGVIFPGTKASPMTTELEVTEGHALRQGYISPYFATDSRADEAMPREPYILLNRDSRKDRSGARTRACARADCPHPQARCLIHRRRHREGTLATLVVNRLRGVLKCGCRQGPASVIAAGRARKDIAVLHQMVS